MHLCQTCYDQHDKLLTVDLFNEYFPKELADKLMKNLIKIKVILKWFLKVKKIF